MKLVQRSGVVITEDMPVDPEAHDLQVSLLVIVLHDCYGAVSACQIHSVLQVTGQSVCVHGNHPAQLYYTSL